MNNPEMKKKQRKHIFVTVTDHTLKIFQGKAISKKLFSSVEYRRIRFFSKLTNAEQIVY